jgi:SagB-type dehydrogenase family enzyme
MRGIALPPPGTSGEVSLEETLEKRRSVRSFSPDPLSLEELSQLLWAAQGITGQEEERTAPSAGATFPIELYLAAGAIEGLPVGVFRYRPIGHRLEQFAAADVRPELVHATGEQEFLGLAPLVMAVAAMRARTRKEYGERAVRYVDMEVGAVLQNAALQGVALGLGSVVVGAFKDEEVKRILGIEGQERFLAMLAVGRPGHQKCG